MTDPRFERQIERLHASGPRPVAELLRETFQRLSATDADWLRSRVERYAEVPPEVYRALGADQFPPPPLYEVRNNDGGPDV